MSKQKKSEYLKMILNKTKTLAYVTPTVTVTLVTGAIHTLGLSVGG